MIDLLRSMLPHVALEPGGDADAAAAGRPARSHDQTAIRVPGGSLLDVCRVLRDEPRLAFAFLVDITAVDWWPTEPRFELVYHFASATERLRLKVLLPGHSAQVPTLQSLWPGASWLEREVWDMFGIVFERHGDLRRLLMPEDWEGHPLRKDYPVQIRLKPRSAEPLQVSEDEFRANLAADRIARSVAPGSRR